MHWYLNLFDRLLDDYSITFLSIRIITLLNLDMYKITTDNSWIDILQLSTYVVRLSYAYL